MKNFRCKICGEEYEKMPKMCPTPGCSNRNPAMWENIAPAAPKPVLTDEEQRMLEQRKSEERRRLESEEKARLIEQQRAAEAERQRELDRLRYEEQQRQQAEAEERRRLESEEKARRLEQQRAAEAERQRELDRLRYEEQQRIQQQTGGFSGYGYYDENSPQVKNEVSAQNNKKVKILLLIITLLLILLFAGILLIAMMNKSDRSRTSSKYSAEETTTMQTRKTQKTTESTTTAIKDSTTTTTPAATTAATTTSTENEEVSLLSALGKSPDEAVDILEKALGVEFTYDYATSNTIDDSLITWQTLYTSKTNSEVTFLGIDFNDVSIAYSDDTVYAIIFSYCGFFNENYTYHAYEEECVPLFDIIYEKLRDNLGEPDSFEEGGAGSDEGYQYYWLHNDRLVIGLECYKNRMGIDGNNDVYFAFSDPTLRPY